MKIPERSPKFDELLHEYAADLGRLMHLAKTGGFQLSSDYLHWDKLRDQHPPEFLTTCQWWLGLKIQRQFGRGEVALKDRHGHPFSLGAPNIFAESLHRLDRGLAGDL